MKAKQLVILLLYVIWSLLALASLNAFNAINALLQIVLILFIYALYDWRKMKIGMIVISISLLIFSQKWMQNLVHIWNEIVQAIGLKFGYILPQYEASPSYIGLILLSLICHLLFIWALKKNYKILFYGIVFSIGIYSILFEQKLMLSYCVFFASTYLLLRLNTEVYWRHSVVLQKGMIWLICSVVLIGIYSAIPTSPYKQNVENTYDKIKKYRYEPIQNTWLNNGDLQTLTENKSTKATALTIRMEKPQALYLKGFVGTDFLNNSWQPLSNQQNWRNQDLFYWLTKNNYTSESVLGQVAEKVEGEKAQKVAIHIEGAASQYQLIPYELTKNNQNILSNQDGLIKLNGLKGSVDYQFEIQPNALVNYPSLASRTQNKDKPFNTAFLDNEAHYNQFVYKNYLTISKKDRASLKKYFKKNKTIQYEQSIKEVKQFLEVNMTYKDKIDGLPSSSSFVDYTLHDNKSGFSAQYATMGTLAFRMLGIPARYIEGYLVTPELIENKTTLEEIKVPSKQAHAWTEIYIDQLGWVPIEVTPTYEQAMPSINIENYPKGQQMKKKEQVNGPELNNDSSTNKSEKLEDNEPVIPPQPKKEKSEMAQWNFIVGGILVVIIILVVLSILSIRNKRRKINQLRRSIHHGNDQEMTRACVTLLHEWLGNLNNIKELENNFESRKQQLPQSLLTSYDKIFTAYQRVHYAQIKMTQQELQDVLTEFNNFETIEKQQFSRWQLVKLKWLKGWF